MGTKGRNRGVNVDELLKLLNKAYADEWRLLSVLGRRSGRRTDAALSPEARNTRKKSFATQTYGQRMLQLGGKPLLTPEAF